VLYAQFVVVVYAQSLIPSILLDQRKQAKLQWLHNSSRMEAIRTVQDVKLVDILRIKE
jgi:precorrin-4 methylase